MQNDPMSYLHRSGIVKNVSKGMEAASKPKVTTKTIAVKREPEFPPRTPMGTKDGNKRSAQNVASTAKEGKSFVDEANTKGGTGDGWSSKPKGSPPAPRTKDSWSKVGKRATNDHKIDNSGMDDEVKYGAAHRAQETKSPKVDPPNTAKRVGAKRANIEGNESAMYERLEAKTLRGLKGKKEKVLREGHNFVQVQPIAGKPKAGGAPSGGAPGYVGPGAGTKVYAGRSKGPRRGPRLRAPKATGIRTL